MGYVENIINAWERVETRHKISGAAWYVVANQKAKDIAQETGVDLERVSLIISALSPACPWEKNVEDARQLILHGESAVVGTYGANKATALRILRGEQTELKGPKTRAFAYLIQYPTDGATVVVDRHAISIALGYKASDKERGFWSREKNYFTIAQAYQQAAQQLGVKPSILQATTWVWYRGE